MNKIFENIGIANTEEEFLNIKKFFLNYDDFYIACCVNSSLNKQNIRIEKMYEISNKYLDKDFLKEFKLKGKFNARLRELYVINFFIENGYELCVKNNKGTPDIKLKYKNKIIWIECVNAGKGEGKNQPYNFLEDGGYSGPIDDIDIPRKLRLLNSLDKKRKKYENYLNNGMVNKNDIYIIALNGGEVGGNSINNGIESLLFGYGKTMYKKDRVSGNLVGPFFKKRDCIKNKNNVNIENNFFENKDSIGISGIIYFGSKIIDCKDYGLRGISDSISTGVGIEFIRNTKAKNKIPDGFLENWELK